MATVNQVYSMLNTVQAMAYGSSAVSVVNTATLVSLGDFVLSSNSNKDKFVNVLFDRIGITLVDTRLYNAKEGNVIRRDLDFGVAMQKIHVEPVEAKENPEWLIGNNDFVPEYAPVLKPTVSQKIFSDMVTYECGVTVPDNMLRTAFVNEVKMAAFIVAIMNALENGIELAKERAIDLTRATMIAYCLKNAGKNSVNLLTEYNNTLPESATPLTADEYYSTEKAMVNGCMNMALTSDRLTRMNKLFNNDGYARHTPKEYQKFDVLNTFDYAVKYGVRPFVYNEEFVKIPNFNTVPYWMGCGTSYAESDISKVYIQKGSGAGVETVANQTGVVGVLYDEEACGVNIFGEESAFDRNDHAHYTTHYRQMTAQYFVDMSEQCVVFYIADPVTPPVSSHEKANLTEAEAKASVKKLASALAKSKE